MSWQIRLSRFQQKQHPWPQSATFLSCHHSIAQCNNLSICQNRRELTQKVPRAAAWIHCTELILNRAITTSWPQPHQQIHLPARPGDEATLCGFDLLHIFHLVLHVQAVTTILRIARSHNPITFTATQCKRLLTLLRALVFVVQWPWCGLPFELLLSNYSSGSFRTWPSAVTSFRQRAPKECWAMTFKSLTLEDSETSGSHSDR